LISLKANIDISIKDAFENFINNCIVKNLRPASIEYYKESWKKLQKVLGSLKLENINKKLVESYIIYLKKDNNLADVTINTNLRGIRAILYYFMDENYIERFKIKLIKADTSQKETYIENELKILLKKPDIKKCTFVKYRTWVIINFFISTGARLSTALSVKIEDLNFRDELISYNYTKTRREQIVPMSNTLKMILLEYIRIRKGESKDYLFCNVKGSKLAIRVLQENISDYNKLRGVQRTSIHAFRHTYARMWIVAGGNMFALQRLLGHTNLEMTKQYVNLYANDSKNDYNELNPLERLSKKIKNIKMRGY